MRALVSLLAANPHIWSLNLGEREGFAFTVSEYDIICRAIELGCTGLAMGWIEHQWGALGHACHAKGRFFDALNVNRRRMQAEARQIFAATGDLSIAMRRIPWRDRHYRQGLRASSGVAGLSEYALMGQHHIRNGVAVWGNVDGALAAMSH